MRKSKGYNVELLEFPGRIMLVAAGLCVLAFLANVVHAQTFFDSGFENYDLSSGDFLQPTSGSWTFTNNAGVVRPYSPNSSTGDLRTWSATFAPHDGEQYASTYAGGDYIHQKVSFAAAGSYAISVYAAAPSGSVTFPSVGTLALGDGEFKFRLNANSIGAANTVIQGDDWSLYSAVFSVDNPGNYELGVINSEFSPYFINYDSFSIAAVPEPAAFLLLLTFVVGLLFARGCRRSVRGRMPSRAVD